MPRAKGGSKSRQRRKKIMKLAKGYVGGRGRLYRSARETVERGAGVCLSRPASQEANFSRTLDHANQRRGKNQRNLVQPADQRPQGGGSRIGSQRFSRKLPWRTWRVLGSWRRLRSLTSTLSDFLLVFGDERFSGNSPRRGSGSNPAVPSRNRSWRQIRVETLGRSGRHDLRAARSQRSCPPRSGRGSANSSINLRTSVR